MPKTASRTNYQVSVWTADGLRIAALGCFGNVACARQAILDHANIVDLPTETPFFCPDIGVIEGWFVGRTEYLIELTQ
jgi:hypothetical protein